MEFGAHSLDQLWNVNYLLHALNKF